MSTTINNYSVGLSLNASSYIRESSLARNETAALRRAIDQARTPAENYTRAVDKLDRALAEGAIEQGTYNRLLDAAKQKYEGAAKSSNSYLSSITKTAAATAAAYVSFGAVKSFAADAVTLAAEAETAAISFEVLTGSAAEAENLVKGLKQLAATTPLGLGDTQAAAKTMLAFNIETSRILPTLKMLGDVTGGNSERFKSLSLAFAQMSAAGRLMGQDLLQMINAGFNPLQEISRLTGESLIDLKKRMEDGAISSQEVASAFESATQAGGRFFGMTDRLAQTTEGRLAILKDSIDEIKRALGEIASTDIVAAQIEGAAGFMSSFAKGLNAIPDFFSAKGLGKFKSEENAAKAIAEQDAFLQQQLAKKRAGTLPVIQTPQASGVDQGIGSLIDRGMESLRTGAGGLVDVVSAVKEAAVGISYVGVANTKELIKATKEDPAIKSLEVGTQEAYSYLTQASRDAEKQARAVAAKQAQMAENAKAQRETMVKWLEKLNTAFENNGFKRFR